MASSLRLTITTVGPATGSVGLAEFQAWTSGSTPTSSPTPVPPPITPTSPVPPPVEPVVCGTPTSPTTATVPTPTTMPAVSTDLAAAASVTASSENAADGQTAAKAVDGTVDGYPGDWTAEWAAQGCTAGTWLQLTWPTAVTLDRIVLHDRPNAYDQITGGTLTFADGTTVAVPELANDGSATTVSFPARSTTSLRLTVTGVSATTSNVGLAELQAWTAVPAAPVTLTGGVGTQWNGVGSWIQLNWRQAVTTGRIVITDPTGTLGLTGATVTFSDGTTATVPVQAIDGKTLALVFPSRSTTTLRLTVTSTKGTLANADKAGLQVFAS